MELGEKSLVPQKDSDSIKEVIPPSVVKKIARDIVEISLKIKLQEKVLIFYDPSGQILVDKLNEFCKEKGAKVSFYKRDYDKEIEIVKGGDQRKIDTYFQKQKEKMDKAGKVVLVRALENPDKIKELSKKENEVYNQKLSEIHQRRFEGNFPWLLIDWPTFYDAFQEGLTIDEYCQEYLKACDQPWSEIKKAQEKLVEKLNKGEKIQLIFNENDPDENKRTDLTMSIKDMTFINCTIDWNYPGSEVFSAPVKNSVNGQLYAPGEFAYEEITFKNLFFKFKDGLITEAHSEENDKAFQALLNRDSANRFLGEFAFGTNSGVMRHFKEKLLEEKQAGKIHFALGECYKDKFDAEGLPVNVNNGNHGGKQVIHWDIVTEAKVILDGKVIQENGRFLDPDLEILNPKPFVI